MKFDIDTSDLKALEKKIKRAADKFGGKPVEKILMKGARTIRKEARKRAPKGKTTTSSRVESRSFGLVKEQVTKTHKAGDLRRAILAKKAPRPRRQTSKTRKLLGVVFAGRGYKRDFHKAPHYHLVHDGTAERFHAPSKLTGRRGKSVGHMTANPFFAGAVKSTQNRVLNQIEHELDALYEKGLRREGVI